MQRKHPLGIPDDLFIRAEIPMTKQEVRVLALAKAMIEPGDIIIDIGAGTGSLSVEAALLAPQGHVYALEREIIGVELIKANAAKFGAANVTVVHGAAPEAMAGLPQADVIIVGGSGGRLAEVLEAGGRLLKPGGRFVVMAVTVETLADTLKLMGRRKGYQVDACGLQVTRIRPAGASNMFQTMNQVFVIVCRKGEDMVVG